MAVSGEPAQQARRLEQTMQMHYEVARLRTVDRRLRLCPPSSLGAVVIGENTDDVDFRGVVELQAVERLQFASEHQMQKLLRFVRRGLAFSHEFDPCELARSGRRQPTPGSAPRE